MGWKQLLGQLAPNIGLALGGPLGGMAVSALCDALGLPAGSKEADIEKQLLTNPDKLVELKKAELAFKQRLAELEIDLERVHSEDRNSARQREMAIKDKMPGILSVVITGGFFVTLYQVFVNGVAPGVDSMLVGALLGTLGTAWISVVTYYFGSSSGSEQKNNIIAATVKS